MGKFNVINSELNNQFKFVNENLVIEGSFVKDAKTGVLRSISFAAYTAGEDETLGEYIGNVSGHPKDDEVHYSLTDMTRSKSRLVWDAIDEIEANILPASEN